MRRLSAIALLVISTAAVYPFGRIDLVGHALIMAEILAIAADHERQVHFLPALTRRLGGVPAGLAAALVAMIVGSWGLHVAFSGAGYETRPAARRSRPTRRTRSISTARSPGASTRRTRACTT